MAESSSQPEHTGAAAAQEAAHEVRITSHGKMSAWVEFALKFFEENPGRPLAFHTLPPPPTAAHEPASQSKPKADRMHPSMALVPRLVSVVEIVKREYVKMLDTSLAEQGALSGLYQYNEIGELETSASAGEAGEVDPEQERLQNLNAVLEGKNHLKIKKTAYMKITLCRKELGHPLSKATTYQKPSVRKLSKAARDRAKKRTKKHEETQDKA